MHVSFRIVANPAVRLGKFYRQAADFNEEFDPFSADEVSTLLQVIREHYGFENYVLLLTLFHCGLRAGEAAGLYWSDLDLKNKTLLVRRQITPGRKGKPKTRKKRAVDVSSVLLSELQELKRTRQPEYLAHGKSEIPEFIFLAPGQIIWKDGEPVAHDDRNTSTWTTGAIAFSGKPATRRKSGAAEFTTHGIHSPACFCRMASL